MLVGHMVRELLKCNQQDILWIGCKDIPLATFGLAEGDGNVVIETTPSDCIYFNEDDTPEPL